MRTLLPALLVIFLLPVSSAFAQGAERTAVENDRVSTDSPGRLAPRMSTDAARLTMTTTDNVMILMLTDEVVGLQLTDSTLREIGQEMEAEKEEGVLGAIVAAAVKGSLGTVLERTMEYPIREIRSVEYRDGALVFTSEEGDRLFEDMEVNGTKVTRSFSPRDARAFVKEFRTLKARGR